MLEYAGIILCAGVDPPAVTIAGTDPDIARVAGKVCENGADIRGVVFF
jgi:hypothetical protein